MINDGINNVPEKTIALFDFANGQSSKLIKKPSRKRDWFTPHFYNCHPLAIGNQYGFEIVSAFNFNILWNGGDDRSDINISPILTEEDENIFFTQRAVSNFGHGIVTIFTNAVFRTPPGINLIATGPINTILENITPLTGVIESDNIRTSFTINLKVNQPNMLIHIAKGTPLATLIPIPRYFGDKFEIKDSLDIFDKKIFEEELEIYEKQAIRRLNDNIKIENNEKVKPDRDYFSGKDYYQNKFLDHQKP
jgi:hypothetical protein